MYLAVADFTEYYKISTNDFEEEDLEGCIADHEEKYLKHLLGIDLYALFKADLTNYPADPIPPPLTAKYLVIWNPLEFDNTHGGLYTGGILSDGIDVNKINISEGMKTMLKGFIYFEYGRLQAVKASNVGPTENKNENSKVLRGYKASHIARYNKAIESYKAIQAYISQHKSDYPTYNGVEKDIIIF